MLLFFCFAFVQSLLFELSVAVSTPEKVEGWQNHPQLCVPEEIDLEEILMEYDNEFVSRKGKRKGRGQRGKGKQTKRNNIITQIIKLPIAGQHIVRCEEKLV